jgi:hypothetical protein
MVNALKGLPAPEAATIRGQKKAPVVSGPAEATGVGGSPMEPPYTLVR